MTIHSYSLCDTVRSNCCGTSSLHTSYSHRWFQGYFRMGSFVHDLSSGQAFFRPWNFTSWWPGKLCRAIALSWEANFLFFLGYLFLARNPPISCLASSSLNWSRERRTLESAAWRERCSRMKALVMETSNKNQSKNLHHFFPGRPDG